MLFTGDIEKVAEEAILNCNNNFDNNKNSEDSNKNEKGSSINEKESNKNEKNSNKNNKDNILSSTIIKVAHHGSITSSAIDFLNEVNPKIALIGVGKNNKFKHPSAEVIKRLQGKKIKIYRTDEMGEIKIIVEKNGEVMVNSIKSIQKN